MITKSSKYYPFDCPAYLTGVADRYMRERLMKKFREEGYNISGEQWHILMFLYQEDGLTQKELCQRMGKSKVSVVKAIDLLETNNLAVRIQSEKDLRTKKVFLTPKGQKMEAPILKIAYGNIAEMLKGLSPEEIDIYIKILNKIITNIKD
jgi:MarR family transcriptional regulator, organic hydroperoxide resistance regulator